MSDYIKITDYAAKDALLTGNPSKLVKGTEIGADLDAVAVAVATKFDSTDLGVTVQAYDADLTTWAGVTPGTGIATALAVNVGTAGSPVINGGALGTPSSGTLTNATGLPAAGVTGTALVATGSNLTGGINSARGNITQHATTMDFFAVTSPDILDGTGSAVTITACVNAPQAGATRKFYPIVATVLTHGATFDIAGNANLTAAAGDCWIIEAKTTSTYRVSAVKEDGTAVASSASGRLLKYTKITSTDVTWAKQAGTNRIVVCCKGGGGAGAGTASASGSIATNGGHAGTVVWGESSTLTDTFVATIGAGGTGVSAGSGNQGGTTSFTTSTPTTIASATGGLGASRVHMSRQGGSDVGGNGESGEGIGGAGANGTTGGAAAANSAAGGGGCSEASADRAGGAGGSGVIHVWEYS
jgi:hypothetical protein